LDDELRALAALMPAAVFEKRLKKATEYATVIARVEAERAGGLSTTKALLACGLGDWDRSTYLGRLRRYGAKGLAGLVSHRHVLPANEEKATPEVRQVICAIRDFDPRADVGRIAAANAPLAEELLFAGSFFLRLADERTGYTFQMASAIHEASALAVASAPKPTSPRQEEAGSRDARGRFTAVYNKANLKLDARLGPAFRSVVEKRREVHLGARRLAGDGVATLQRKCQSVPSTAALADYEHLVVESFSGVLMVDEVYDGGYAILCARDP
jgi:hypothetical protein